MVCSYDIAPWWGIWNYMVVRRCLFILHKTENKAISNFKIGIIKLGKWLHCISWQTIYTVLLGPVVFFSKFLVYHIQTHWRLKYFHNLRTQVRSLAFLKTLMKTPNTKKNNNVNIWYICAVVLLRCNFQIHIKVTLECELSHLIC